MSDLMRRPPRYVKAYIDHTGRARFYFRKKGLPRVPLGGLPWSPQFMADYEQALNAAPLHLGKVVPGSFRALVASYLSAPTSAYHDLNEYTQKAYRRLLERLCAEHGHRLMSTFRREHVAKLISDRADKPEAANRLRKALRALMQHAIVMGFRSDDPTREVKRIKRKGDGYHSWTESEISAFQAHHPIGTMPRLALALLIFTGQRRGDVIAMGRQHVSDGLLFVRQQKGSAELYIPVHPTLAEIIAATPRANLTFLTNEFRRPFTPGGFTQWFRKRCNEAGLRHCSAHGLRKSAARRLAEAGCTAHQIAAITGHASLKEVQRYTKAADQKQLAIAAMDKVRTSECLISPPVRQNGKKG